MIFSIFILPILKITSSLVSVIITAGVKTSKDTRRYEISLQHVEEEIAKGGRARQLYGNDARQYMDIHKPITIKFGNEFICNAHRPLFILYAIMLWAQLTYPIAVMAVLLGLSFYFIEQHIESLKEKKWYKVTILALWLVTYPILLWSEWLFHN